MQLAVNSRVSKGFSDIWCSGSQRHTPSEVWMKFTLKFSVRSTFCSPCPEKWTLRRQSAKHRTLSCCSKVCGQQQSRGLAGIYTVSKSGGGGGSAERQLPILGHCLNVHSPRFILFFYKSCLKLTCKLISKCALVSRLNFKKKKLWMKLISSNLSKNISSGLETRKQSQLYTPVSVCL